MNPFTKKPETQLTPEEIKMPVAPPQAAAVAPVAPPLEQRADPIVILSDIDGYIHERIKEQPKTLADIAVMAPEFEKTNDVLRLPRELDKYTKEYGFKWISKSKRSIDRNLDILGFVLLTKQHFPSLPKRMFSSQGCIERGDAVLGFIPIKRAVFLRTEPGRKSMERVKNLPMEKWKDPAGGEKYYKPTLTEEKDGQEIVAGIQPDAKEFQDN